MKIVQMDKTILVIFILIENKFTLIKQSERGDVNTTFVIQRNSS